MYFLDGTRWFKRMNVSIDAIESSHDLWLAPLIAYHQDALAAAKIRTIYNRPRSISPKQILQHAARRLKQ
jgi:hypothetical protein